MDRSNDPRLRGFNYGSGWGDAPKPPVYHAAAKLAYDLGRAGRVIMDRAWDLEMKLRSVRLAHYPEEKEAAVARLVAAYAQYEVYLAEAFEKVCEIEGATKAA